MLRKVFGSFSKLIILTCAFGAGGASADESAATERECRREVRKMEDYIVENAWTCTSKCSKNNLHFLIVTATARNETMAVRTMERGCANLNKHVVPSLITCFPNFVQVDLHSEFDADCEKRKAALETELLVPRIACTAKLSDRYGTSYSMTGSARTVQDVFNLMGAKAEHHGLSFRSFSAQNCERR